MNRLHNNRQRAARTRAGLKSNTDRFRVSVFISNCHVYVQVIDDKKGVTIVSVSDKDVAKQGKNIEIARLVGELLASRAKEKKVKEVVFDRGGRRYHGRVKALAEGARKELVF